MLSTSLWPPAIALSRTSAGGSRKPSTPVASARSASGPAMREKAWATRTTRSRDAARQHDAVIAQAAVLRLERLEREPCAEAVRDDAHLLRAGAVDQVAQF